ncbi:MAG: serine/threonine protein kinase [Kofleriaceae bacterium]|nr:serine/threonine protein kinase [Kofleriaceae bacterium]
MDVKGKLAGHYVIGDLLGEGGMGAVYRASHRTLDTPAAVKVLNEEAAARPDLVARFQQEAMAAARITQNGQPHPNIARAIDTGTLDDGRSYIVVEYLEGRDLDGYLHEWGGRLGQRDALEIFLAVCAALHAAHTAREPHRNTLAPIVHRDLKPGNIFVTSDAEGERRIKLLDFGIAKMASSAKATGIATGARMVMGTAVYMAPEQALTPSRVDARADIYAAGVVLFQMLTGRFPFDAPSLEGLIFAKQSMKIDSVRSYNADLHPYLDTVIARCLAFAAEHRYPDIRSVVRDVLESEIPEVEEARMIAWPGFYKQGSSQEETTRAPIGAKLPPPPPGFITGGTLAAAAGATPTVAPRASRSTRALLLGGVAIVAAAIVTIAITTSRGNDSVTGNSETQPATAPPTSATTTPPTETTPPPTETTPPPPISATTPPPTETTPPPPTSATTPPPTETTTPPPTETTTPPASATPRTKRVAPKSPKKPAGSKRPEAPAEPPVRRDGIL